MNTPTRRAVLCVFLTVSASVCIPVAAGAQGGDVKDSNGNNASTRNDERSGWAVRNEGEAVAKALGVIGVSAKDAPKVTTTLVTLAEDNTPFLRDKVIGRPVWNVVVGEWRLQLESSKPEETDSYSRTVDILVDPETGNLLKITSRWPRGIPRSAVQPSADSAEEQMQNAGLEKYHSFPKADPSISFLEALDVVAREGGLGNPLTAKQISAHYVVRSAMGGEPRPVWAITLWGIPPFEAAYPGVPVDARNHIRHIVDAETGKWLCAGTSPQPES